MFQPTEELLDSACAYFGLGGIQRRKPTQARCWTLEPMAGSGFISFEELDGQAKEAGKAHDVIAGLRTESSFGLAAAVEGWHGNTDLASQFPVGNAEQFAEGVELADVEAHAHVGNHVNGRGSLLGLKITRHDRFHENTIDCSYEKIKS